MSKWVAGISLCLAIILFGVAGWTFFQHRYCNAQRLNQELAAAHRPALLAEFIAQDHQIRNQELRQTLSGGILVLIAVTLWTGRLDPGRLRPRLRKHPALHR